MRLHRFILDIDLDQDQALVVDPKVIQQWKNVLRLKRGNQLMIGNGQGWEAKAEIISLDKGAVRLALQKPVRVEREPQRQVTLYCAVIKRENFEWAAQKAVEVGVIRVVPVITNRTIKKDIKQERVATIMREAAEQAGRGVLPALHQPLSFAEALLDAKHNEQVFFFDASGPAFETGAVTGERVGAFIGPEGGWSEPELHQAESAGLNIMNLGDLTLRAETAVVVASYLLTH